MVVLTFWTLCYSIPWVTVENSVPLLLRVLTSTHNSREIWEKSQFWYGRNDIFGLYTTVTWVTVGSGWDLWCHGRPGPIGEGSFGIGGTAEEKSAVTDTRTHARTDGHLEIRL